MPGKATRDGLGEGLVELGRTNPDVVVLTGDLAGSTRAEWFAAKYPDRFFNMGICEQDMVGAAAGLALEAKIPFACSFSVFLTGRAYEQIRISICYNEANVKLAGTHAGLTVGPDGATAQALEDIAAMRALPGMAVVVPADALEARKATIAAAAHKGPVYLRFSRNPYPLITREEDAFAIGKINILRQGHDVAICACGLMVSEALAAAGKLAEEGIQAAVANVHTIKPLDTAALLELTRRCGAMVTAEEHQLAGGLGGAIAEAVVTQHPVPTEMVGIRDTFGESGGERELQQKYGITDRDIYEAAKRVLKRK
ncbi:MAG: transketolase family protein [Chloroflexi bacterium]|nr:transketolase family protein [Chloroflexota bacterium]